MLSKDELIAQYRIRSHNVAYLLSPKIKKLQTEHGKESI